MKIINMYLEKVEKIEKNINLRANVDKKEYLEKIEKLKENISIEHETIKKIENIKLNEKMYTQNLIKLINENINAIKLEPNEYNHEDEIGKINNRIEELKRIELLEPFSKNDKDVILIGGNGTGKSFLANYLKGTSTSVVVIPAHKYLFLNDNSYNNYWTMNKNDFLNERKNINAKSLHKNNEFITIYSKLIMALINDYGDELHRMVEGNNIQNEKKILYKKIKEIFEQLLKTITIDVEISSRKIIPIKDGDKFDFNQMSDGERAILFYIIQVIMSEENSYIIIDEPETHLNTALIMKLWDILKKERRDCKFVFISHNIDFINTRTNVDIFWIKNFKYPDKWEIENIEIINELPLELITKIIGSKKPILFCEGTNDSYDYKIYSQIFLDSHNVYPVGGHKEVINFVKTYRKTKELSKLEVYGIIDGDLIEDFEIIKLKQEKILVLPFNEIEMFLLDEDIIENVLSQIYQESDVAKKILDFKKNLIQELEKNKEIIVLSKIKKFIDTILEREKIEHSKTLEGLKENFTKITSISIDKKYDEYKNALDNVIEDRNYNDILKWCSLKSQISRGLANQILDNDYIKKSVVRINKDSKLREKLKNKYFIFQ